MKRVFLPFIIAIMLCIAKTNAQSVGLVMSGGGAKGVYHIGVIEALEERGIPIDYIAGTSIGAIVAGLYAAGYSTEEMRELATSGELEKWTSGKIDHNHRSYFRRASTISPEEPAITYHFKTTNTTNSESSQRIPRSIISTTQIDLALSELFTPATVACDSDFSQLMIPFFCYASDITDNRGVVLKRGDLGKSIRASMALPLMFKPIVDDSGHILYDGGIYDNFPWQSMVDEFSPDVIIGSVCGVDSWADTSDLNIMDQAFLLAMNPTNYDLPEGSITMKRNVPIGMLEFSKSDMAIQMGYDDTNEKIDSILVKLSPSSLKDAEYYSNRRAKFRSQLPQLIFDSVAITGLDQYKKEYVDRYMTTTRNDIEREKESMSFNKLRNNLYSILSTNEFTTDYPSITYDSISSRYRFIMDMEHRSTFKVSVSGNISSTAFNQLYMSINYTTIKRVARELFAELYLGPVYTTGRLGIRTDRYTNTPLFIDTYLNFATKNLNHGNFGNLTPVDNATGMSYNDIYLSFGLGSPIKDKALIVWRTNAGRENFNYNYSTPTDSSQLDVWGEFDKTRLAYLATKLEYERSTIDNFNFPTKGSIITLSAIAVTGEEKSYSVLINEYSGREINNTLYNNRSWIGAKVNYTKYVNPSPKQNFSFCVSAEAVFTTIPDTYTATARQIMMPAYQPTLHTQTVYMPELSASRYLAFGFMPNVRLWRELYLRSGVYTLITDHFDSTLEVSADWGISSQYIAQTSLAYNTPMGPLSISLSKYGVENWNKMYLTFNFGMTIFSPRGTFY